MISVNNLEFQWDESQNQTVKTLIEFLQSREIFAHYLDSKITVVINGDIVLPEDYEIKMVQDFDAVRIYPMVYGG